MLKFTIASLYRRDGTAEATGADGAISGDASPLNPARVLPAPSLLTEYFVPLLRA
jgi:hypothetical protein